MSKVEQIKEKLDKAGIRYWANDNISSVLEEGDKQQLIEEAIPAFENVLQTLLIDTKTKQHRIRINQDNTHHYDCCFWTRDNC